MSLQTYLRLVLALMLVDAIVLGLLYSLQLATAFTPALLATRAAVDLLFIGTNVERVGLKARDGAMIFWLVGAGLAGTVLCLSGVAAYSLPRVARDVILPIIFILKLALIVRLLPGLANPAAELRTLVRWLVVGSVLQIAIFLWVGRLFGAYAGVAVPATLPLADALARNGIALGLLMFVLILASGKRAILLSALAAAGVLALSARRRLMVLAVVLIMAAALTLAAPLFESTVGKFQTTVTAVGDLGGLLADGPAAVLDNEVRAGLYLATAGRSEEFYSLVHAMRPANYLFGLGAGFTYEYAHTDGVISGYSNSHFSPLSLTYKFGFVFCLFFYIYTFRNTLALIKGSEWESRLVGLALLMLGVQSLFSFNLFAEPLLPILSAIGAYRCGERYGPAAVVSGAPAAGPASYEAGVTRN